MLLTIALTVDDALATDFVSLLRMSNRVIDVIFNMLFFPSILTLGPPVVLIFGGAMSVLSSPQTGVGWYAH